MTASSMEEVRDRLVGAALPHVAFDGWSRAAFQAAVGDSGVDPALARIACPRGGLDLARAFHLRGDRLMVEQLGAMDLGAMRFRDRVETAVRLRLELAGDREAVRRGMTLFSLPNHAAEGSALVWGTADAIWNALGDQASDLNWYTKRMSLASVFGATVLYWLGDDTPGHKATWEFLGRRLDAVMRIEKAKQNLREAPILGKLMAGPEWLAAQVRVPSRCRDKDQLPGHTG